MFLRVLLLFWIAAKNSFAFNCTNSDYSIFLQNGIVYYISSYELKENQTNNSWIADLSRTFANEILKISAVNETSGNFVFANTYRQLVFNQLNVSKIANDAGMCGERRTTVNQMLTVNFTEFKDFLIVRGCNAFNGKSVRILIKSVDDNSDDTFAEKTWTNYTRILHFKSSSRKNFNYCSCIEFKNFIQTCPGKLEVATWTAVETFNFCIFGLVVIVVGIIVIKIVIEHLKKSASSNVNHIIQVRPIPVANVN